MVDDAGLAVGRALGNVANLINPEVIVVGGPLAGLGDLLLDPIRRGLIRHAVPVIGETTTLTMSSLGDRAEALGRRPWSSSTPESGEREHFVIRPLR